MCSWDGRQSQLAPLEQGFRIRFVTKEEKERIGSHAIGSMMEA